MRKKSKLSTDGGDYGNKKCKRGCGGALMGSGGVCVWREPGVSHLEDVFTFNLVYKEIL
jgi:hypothetical protein